VTKPGSVEHVSILWAGTECAGELERLHAPLFSPAWDAVTFKMLLDHPGSTAFIARAGEPLETMGFILGRLTADEAEILTLGVCESWQRRGIGRRLAEAFSRAVRRAEGRRLHLEVAATNTSALRLYRGLGFEEIGRRKGYYDRPGALPEDAINLSLAL
jgi:[ribosomal protein S18]-alanine N-acetyltransferase